MKLTLNEGQEQAKEDIIQFLGSGDKYFVLDSAAGFGKSTLLTEVEGGLAHFNNKLKLFNLPQFSRMVYTASTNKAATLLGDAGTIHKLLGLRVVNDFKSGNSYLAKTNRSAPLFNTILVIDEASMLDPNLLKIIDDLVQPCSKVIFSMDSYQLAPVKHIAPTASTKGYSTAKLSEPMRQDKDSHLFKMCTALRTAVKTGKYFKLVEGEGVTFLSGSDFLSKIHETFTNQEDARVLCYQNSTVENFNKNIRTKVKGASGFMQGDLVVAASAMEGKFKVEQTYRINAIGEPIDVNGMACQRVTMGGETAYSPVDKQMYFQQVKRAQKEAKGTGDWTAYFELKNNLLDIRDASACTVHASQGSTYNTVFIDFSDLCKMTDLNTFLRAIYVAVSRARTQVYIYGL